MLTAVAWLECRCTTAAASLRSPYIDRCRNASFVGVSPDISRPVASRRDSRAWSSAPKDTLVAAITQPPSSSRTEILPLLPAVSPRSNSDAPTLQISSRMRLSSGIGRLRFQQGPGFQEEILGAKVARFQGQYQIGARNTARPRHAGGDFGTNFQHRDAKCGHHRARSLAARNQIAAESRITQ